MHHKNTHKTRRLAGRFSDIDTLIVVGCCWEPYGMSPPSNTGTFQLASHWCRVRPWKRRINKQKMRDKRQKATVVWSRRSFWNLDNFSCGARFMWKGASSWWVPVLSSGKVQSLQGNATSWRARSSLVRTFRCTQLLMHPMSCRELWCVAFNYYSSAHTIVARDFICTGWFSKMYVSVFSLISDIL